MLEGTIWDFLSLELGCKDSGRGVFSLLFRVIESVGLARDGGGR